MLVLSRKVGESIIIDGDIVITISSVQGGRVKLGIEAPRHKQVQRGELVGPMKGPDRPKALEEAA